MLQAFFVFIDLKIVPKPICSILLQLDEIS